jgi:hypothetical protein
MAEKKSLVEEAIIQMKNLEETVAQNAKGILASTMKQEIKQLVKESLSENKNKKRPKVEEEEDEEDMDFEDTDVADVEFPDDEEDMEDMDDEEMSDDEEMYDDEEDMDDEEMSDDEEDMEDMDDEEEVLDLTNEKNIAQVLKVYSLLDPKDEVVVTKDKKGNISFKDNETDKEYLIVTESMDDMESAFSDEFGESYDFEEEMFSDDSDFYKEGEYEQLGETSDDILYELEIEDDDMGDMYEETMEDEDSLYEMDFSDEMMEDEDSLYEMDDELYEDDMELGMMEMNTEDTLYESKKKKGFKPKGKGFGNANSYKFSSKPNMEGGFKVVHKKADKSMGTGSAKKVKIYKDSPSMKGDFSIKPKKVETKEASRTLGSGSKFRHGGLPKPRAHSAFNSAIQKESTDRELDILREKNEEYKKALNIFRNKLNEVAVFNSNLAYATRLFTEHSTSKQEKINILQRFDSVETIKESKGLYKVIKDELSNSKPQQVNESVERTIQKTPTTGSAVNLIESKTYENPQFLRMKDLMSKLK